MHMGGEFSNTSREHFSYGFKVQGSMFNVFGSFMNPTWIISHFEP
jgi:hypothetical protein